MQPSGLCHTGLARKPAERGERAPRKHSPGCCIVPELVRDDASGDADGGDNIGKVSTQLLDKGLLVARAGQEPAVKREGIERAEEAQTMNNLTDK